MIHVLGVMGNWGGGEIDWLFTAPASWMIQATCEIKAEDRWGIHLGAHVPPPSPCRENFWHNLTSTVLTTETRHHLLTLVFPLGHSLAVSCSTSPTKMSIHWFLLSKEEKAVKLNMLKYSMGIRRMTLHCYYILWRSPDTSRVEGQTAHERYNCWSRLFLFMNCPEIASVNFKPLFKALQVTRMPCIVSVIWLSSPAQASGDGTQGVSTVFGVKNGSPLGAALTWCAGVTEYSKVLEKKLRWF